MTFNDNANVEGSKARRRGAGIAMAGGGVAGLGVDEGDVENCTTGADANRDDSESPTRAQIDDALNAAAAFGDDHIQEATGADACDTFSVAEGKL